MHDQRRFHTSHDTPPSLGASYIGLHTEIYTGLGHGDWIDYKLTRLLSVARTGNEPQSRMDKHLKWIAGTDEWDPIYWEGRDKIVGGHLKLRMHGDEEVLAVYKFSGANWLQRVYYHGRNGFREEWEEAGKASRGSLGISKKEGITEQVVQHMLMICIGIEEQIRHSKGFSAAYHGGWI